MIRRAWLSGCLMSLALSSSSYSWAASTGDLSAVLSSIVENRQPVVSYVETRHMAMLDQPLVAKGEMRFSPPDHLEKIATSPKAERMVLDGNKLSLERDGRTVSINLSGQPQAQAFVDSIRALLMGQREALERSYLVHLSGTPRQWTMALYPTDVDVERLVKRIDVTGADGQIRKIEYQQAGGDRTVMEISSKGSRP